MLCCAGRVTIGGWNLDARYPADAFAYLGRGAYLFLPSDHTVKRCTGTTWQFIQFIFAVEEIMSTTNTRAMSHPEGTTHCFILIQDTSMQSNNLACGKMNTLNVITDGDSPRGWQQYMLLHSPKSGLISRSKLPFIILCFGAGVLLGGTWNKIGLRMTSGYATFPKSQHFASAKADVDETAKSFLRKQSATDSLPIAWLMSFPVSTSIANFSVQYWTWIPEFNLTLQLKHLDSIYNLFRFVYE